MGVSAGTVVVTSGLGEGNPHAVISMDRMNRKDVNTTSLLDGFMGKSFFE
jgi:hypothetical protein